VHESVGPDKVHPRVLRKLVKLLSHCPSYLRSCGSPVKFPLIGKGEIRRGKKEDLGNYRPVSLTSLPGKVMEQTLPETMLRHM